MHNQFFHLRFCKSHMNASLTRDSIVKIHNLALLAWFGFLDSTEFGFCTWDVWPFLHAQVISGKYDVSVKSVWAANMQWNTSIRPVCVRYNMLLVCKIYGSVTFILLWSYTIRIFCATYNDFILDEHTYIGTIWKICMWGVPSQVISCRHVFRYIAKMMIERWGLIERSSSFNRQRWWIPYKYLRIWL